MTKGGKTFGPAHSLPQFLWLNPGIEIWTHEAKNEDLRLLSQQWMVDWPNNNFVKKINAHLREKVLRIKKIIKREKSCDLLSNSLIFFFKEKLGDNSGVTVDKKICGGTFAEPLTFQLLWRENVKSLSGY